MQVARAIMIEQRNPSPVQCFAFRSSIGERKGNYIHNLGVWENRRPFCSFLKGPGCFTVIPYVSNDRPFKLDDQMM